jgi:cell division ATPase FtsA
VARRFWPKFKRSEEVGEGPAYRSVLDVGTTWAKTLVVVEQDGEVRVIGRGRAHHRGAFSAKGTVADPNALAVACEAALCQAEDMTEETTGHKIVPDIAVIGVPSRWLTVASQSFTLRRRRPEVKIEEREVEGVVARAGRLALQEVATRRMNTAASLTVLEASLVALTVDGHRVTDPVGFRGDELGATVCVAVALDEDLSALRALAEALELEPPRLVAEPQAVARQLACDGIVLDIGGTTTGVYLMRYGQVLAADALPLGEDGFSQSLAAVFNLTGRQVQALRRAYEEGLLAAEDAVQVQAALNDTIQNCLRAVEISLERMAGADDLPHQIYLCGGGSRWPDVLDAARVHPWMQSLPFVRYPQVQRLDPVQFPSPINDTERLWDVEEAVSLSLACWPTHSSESPVERALVTLRREVLE